MKRNDYILVNVPKFWKENTFFDQHKSRSIEFDYSSDSRTVTFCDFVSNFRKKYG